MRFLLESTVLKEHLFRLPLRQELQLTFQLKSQNPVRKQFYTGHSVCFQTGIDVSVWPAFETWAELLVEVPVEVETTIDAPLDLLTLKKSFYDKYEFHHCFIYYRLFLIRSSIKTNYED